MHRTEEEILEELEQKVSTFTMEIGDNVWPAIEKEIELDQDSYRKDAIWWFTLSLSSFTAFLSITFLHGNTDATSHAIHSSPEIISRASQKQSTVFKNEKVPNKNGNNNYISAHLTEASVSKNVISLLHPSYHTSKQSGNSALTHYPSKNSYASDVRKINKQQKAGTVSEERLVSAEIPKEVSKEKGRNTLKAEQEMAPTIEHEQVGIVGPEQQISRMSPCMSQPPISKWYILAYSGIGTSYRNLSGETNAQGIVDHRNTHERSAMTFDAGIAGTFDFGKASYVLLGVNYSRYAEKYDFHHDVISHTTVNDYGYMQLSLNYGQRIIQIGNRSSISAFGGFRIGKLLHAQSSWIDPAVLLPVAHSNSQTNHPFEVWNYGYNVGLDYKVRVARRIGIHFIPLLEGMFNSSYKKETLLTQRPYAITLNAGVSYRF